MRSGPIIIVEDDADDKDVMEDAIKELQYQNRLMWFNNCDDAWQYLKTTAEQPFIIFSDINLPRQSGLEFKRQIDNDPQLRRKSIPFIFYSTSVNQDTVNEAHVKMTVQGFFQKGNSYEEMKNTLRIILDYWLSCKHPNTR